MLITKRTYKKKYVIGGADIFDSIGNYFARKFLSNAAKQLASTALQAGKTAAKDIGMKAIDVGKTVTIYAGKKLVGKSDKKLSAPKSQVGNVMVPPEEITKKVSEVLAKYVDTSAINLNKLLDGSSVNRANASNVIAIQDLVIRLNGSGLKVTHIFFFFYLPIPQLSTKASKIMSITNMNLSLAPVLITMMISELVSHRKMCSLILARAT